MRVDDNTIMNSTDTSRFTLAKNGTIWDPRADMDDDGGAIDADDQTAYTAKSGDWSGLPVTTVAQPVSDVGNPFGWQGRVHFNLDYCPDADAPVANLMLIDHRNRMHDSVIGRWLTRDPIGYRLGSLNLYEYVHGNPLYWLDPYGREPVDDWFTRWSWAHPAWSELCKRRQETLYYGCIGITCLNLGVDLTQQGPDMSKCYTSLSLAAAKRAEMAASGECGGKNSLGEPSSPKIFGFKGWSGGNGWKANSDGTVDTGGWWNGRGPGYTNFDFGWPDDPDTGTGNWTHANHCHHCKNGAGEDQGPMDVSNDSWIYTYDGFETQPLYCVACESADLAARSSSDDDHHLGMKPAR
jgi:RHS repeat-associated protein